MHQGSSGEEVKLLDFGIAKLNNNQSHTLTGQLFGTPYFMAPEQILGQKNISPATDMYSLGAVLFYCLTRLFHDGDSQFMILISMSIAQPHNCSNVIQNLMIQDYKS